jgi:hypothetical protein
MPQERVFDGRDTERQHMPKNTGTIRNTVRASRVLTMGLMKSLGAA